MSFITEATASPEAAVLSELHPGEPEEGNPLVGALAFFKTIKHGPAQHRAIYERLAGAHHAAGLVGEPIEPVFWIQKLDICAHLRADSASSARRKAIARAARGRRT